MAPGSRRRFFVVIGLVVVVVAAALVLHGRSSPSPTTTATTTTASGSSSTRAPSIPSSLPTAPVAGPFTVSGNKILDAAGQQFVPRGFVLYCLAIPDIDCSQPGPSDPQTDSQKIQVAASFWHANTVRLQVAQERLFDGTGHVDTTYLAQLDSEVALANRLGMVAIVTLQEERYNGPPLPTDTAVAFWKVIAAHYKGNPMAMFDLYNEPRLVSQDIPPSELSTSAAFPTTGTFAQNLIWNLWRNGGSATVEGGSATSYDFVGMQQLVSDVRATGAQNVLIAEGNHGDHDLSGVAGLPEASGGSTSYALSGTGIAYGIEPDLHPQALGPVPATDSAAAWDAVFGNLSNSFPIVMAAFQDWSPGGFCDTRAPKVLPKLLDYLGRRHLGLIAWALEPGILIQGDNLEDPTTFQGLVTQPCGQRFNPDGTIGAGADILQFFTRYPAAR